jgi:heptosyltransferase-2
MKTCLFCKNPYAFGILKPLYDVLVDQGHPVIWYIPEEISDKFLFGDICNYTSEIQEINDFNSDVIIVPGNEVPHYLRGVKVQIFHGLAGEKKGHFRIRTYFDLYLTQGPYFTSRFNTLAKKHKDFEVIETGWPKLDSLFKQKELFNEEKQLLLKDHSVKKIILYAPTFSPSLTSAIALKDELLNLVNKDTLLLIKFHDLMDKKIIGKYQELMKNTSNVKIIKENNIVKYLILADLLISDTSSVVYEFLLLNKPVITLNSSSQNIKWKDIHSVEELIPAFNSAIDKDEMKEERQWIIDNYHPYTDGMSSKRMINTLEKYIQENPIPLKRKIPWLRRKKMIKMFGSIASNNRKRLKKEPKKFLIIQTAFIGDVVLATPIVEKLHEFYADPQIDFALRKGNENLLEDHPYISNLLIWNKTKRKTRNLLRIIKLIRKNKYDYVINLQRYTSTGLMTAFSRSKVTIGFNKNPISFLFSRKIKHELGKGKHEIERNIELISEITDGSVLKPKLYPTDKDYQKVSQYKTEPYICIAPKSVWFTKQLPSEKWVELINKIDSKYFIYLIGGSDDKDSCDRIILKSDRNNVINLCEKLSFLQTSALLIGAKMNFANDSAPMHMASAMNAPITAVFCSTIPDFGFGPLSEQTKIVETTEKLDCRPCGLHGFNECPEGHFNCANTISISQLEF